MPPTFRIHQTKSKPERILIRLLQGRYIIPAISAPATAVVPVSVANVTVSNVVVPEKKKTSISIKQIKQIVMLLQAQQKNVSKLLPPELKSLLAIDEHVNPDEVPAEDDEDLIEALSDPDEKEEDDDDDVLIIDLE
jgi:hypothetical protein